MQNSDATKATREYNEKVLKELPFADTQSFKNAERGFIANDLALNKTNPLKAIASGRMKIKGKKLKFIQLMRLEDKFNYWFNIITP